MTDDLVSGHIDWLRGDHEYCNPILADCIEQLEAKLEKALQLLDEAMEEGAVYRHDFSGWFTIYKQIESLKETSND
jgi:hypothetical protein